MACKRRLLKTRRNKNSAHVRWNEYPSPHSLGFGSAKFCYFTSCPESELPIRDYVHEAKEEPHYEDKTYNMYEFCNQRGIRRALDRGISYILFITRYYGKMHTYSRKIYATGWFPISYHCTLEKTKMNESGKEIYPSRVAYKSSYPIFLTIENSMELNEARWRDWFGVPLPTNLRHCAKFLNAETDNKIIKEVMRHFEKNKEHNNLVRYVKEIRRFTES